MAFTTVGARTEGLARMSLHALLGCVQGAMSGGKCGPSAIAAFVGKAATENIPNETGPFARGVITAVAGGTASLIGGGKFANGSFQAAFGYLFNYCETEPAGCFGSVDAMGNPTDANYPGARQAMALAGGVYAAGVGVAVAGGGMATGAVVLDTNAVIGLLERGATGVLAPGQRAYIPITVAKEFLAGGGSATALRELLISSGGRIIAGSAALAGQLQQQALSLRRVLDAADAQVVSAAVQRQLPLITQDGKVQRFMKAVGEAVKGF